MTLDDRVRHIVAHAYTNTTAMKKRLDEASLTLDDLQNVADLNKLPTISKDDMVRLQAEAPPFGGMLAVPAKDLAWIFFSPGPLYEGVADAQAAIEATARLLSDVGFDENDIVQNTLSYHLVPFGIRFDAGARHIGATVLPTGVGNTDLQVKMMLELGATAYIGTPSFLMALIQKVEEMGGDFAKQSQLKKAIVTAEPLSPSQRESLKGYGITLVNLFGTAELGMLGYECRVEKGFHIPDEVLVQICDPTSGEALPFGEVGEIVATIFHEDYPLIRIGTGDLSIINPEPCECGRTTHRLMGWMGRSGEAVKVRGMFLHPNQLRMVLANFPAVSAFQAVITRPDQRDVFTLNLELGDPNADQDALSAAIMEAITPVCRVRADTIEFLPAGSIEEGARGVVDARTWE